MAVTSCQFVVVLDGEVLTSRAGRYTLTAPSLVAGGTTASFVTGTLAIRSEDGTVRLPLTVLVDAREATEAETGPTAATRLSSTTSLGRLDTHFRSAPAVVVVSTSEVAARWADSDEGLYAVAPPGWMVTVGSSFVYFF
jgi:hypothetical protein